MPGWRHYRESIDRHMIATANASTHNRCIALAGLFQAARLVQQTSRAESRDPAATAASIRSLFITEPEKVSDVYGETADLQVGLQVLLQQLSSKTVGRDLELTGYVITLMHLQRKLGRRDDLMQRIGDGIDHLKQMYETTGPEDAELVSALANVYQETVSTLSPRVMVRGDESVLANRNSQSMIRTLLLAGLRAAVLWSQCGGNRFKLIIQRKVMLETCSRILRTGIQAE